MDHGYRNNAKWLKFFAPFRALSISAAYLTPFFLQKGLSLTQVFLLQAIFSLAFLLWELPSGYIADRWGRALSVKLSVPIAAIAMVLYGLSGQFWQFVLCELVLALANGFISGVDTSLLHDSLAAEGRESEFTVLSQRIKAWEYAGVALGVPVAALLVHFVSLSSTIVADGVLTAIGGIFAYRLVEAPVFRRDADDADAILAPETVPAATAWQRLRAKARLMGKISVALVRQVEVRWLIGLGAVLSAATYLTFWLSAPYYQSLGIPTAWFGAILAGRSLVKAWLSHHVHQRRQLERNFIGYAGLAGAVYFAMATGQLWWAPAVLGHDVVQALQPQPITAKLQQYIHSQHRATLNSLVNLIQRLLYTLASPLVGLLVDHVGLRRGLMVTGAMCGAVALVAVARLHRLGTFRESS